MLPTPPPGPSEELLRSLRRALWILCLAVYVLMLLAGISQGGSELGVVLKALGASAGLAFLGRVALGLLSQAQPDPRGFAAGLPVGSLVDLLSPPEPSPGTASPPSQGVEEAAPAEPPLGATRST